MRTKYCDYSHAWSVALRIVTVVQGVLGLRYFWCCIVYCVLGVRSIVHWVLGCWVLGPMH